jgi:rhamnosyltransferase
MFCDQDDIWLPNKIEKMYEAIKIEKQDIPQVVYSNAYLWNTERGIISDKNTLTYPKTLRQMLFLNTGIQGAASIFNQAMCHYLRQPLDCYAMHDHVLLLAGICFGEVHYLHEPLMYYRQHDKNVTGNAPGSIRRKVLLMWQNRKVPLVSRLHWEGLNAFFARFHRELSANDKQLIEVFLRLREQSFVARLSEIVKHRFQLFDSTLLLIIKLCIRRYI